MDNDGFLASGTTSPEIFGNEQPPEDVQAAIDTEREYINSILPTAEEQVRSLNLEIANANKLTDFVSALGVMPTDLSEAQVRSKLESRFGYINYLIIRKNRITDGLTQINQEVPDEPVEIAAPDVPINVPKPKAFWQRLKGRPPM